MCFTELLLYYSLKLEWDDTGGFVSWPKLSWLVKFDDYLHLFARAYLSLCLSVSIIASVCLCVSSEILLDILPTIQTPDVAKVLIQLIRDQSIRGIRSRLSIAAMSLTVKPEPEVVKSLLVSVTWHRAPVYRLNK